ncbi:MAG: hypothetical protein ACI3Y4_04260 [Candidatus Cryptobacteroides sp.]
MRRMSYIVALFALLVLSAGCEPQTVYTPEFLTDSTLRMEVGKQEILTYNPITCQTALNLHRCEFRMHTDNMSEYVIIRFDSMPSEEGESVNASSLVWTSPSGADQTRKNITLEVVKLEGDTAWLWNSRESIRMTVRCR